MPSLLLQPHCTRLSSSSHPYSVQLFHARVNQCTLNHSYIPLVNSETPCLLLHFHLPFPSDFWITLNDFKETRNPVGPFFTHFLLPLCRL
ncbi:hypothetical protein E2C01_056596 [Portunus trituberculatus]|uniref:Uncharacterized protein n=1 Tax=Portunus trituberculatus TaxID=210409 RepID=A0A5B7GQS3_PORTR|nr:hypothetical protein [Portunus trituberculatus]